MKRTLSVKLFAMTLGAFFILIIGIILILSIYFSRFYEPKKIDGMVDAINRFSQDYTENGWTDEEMYERVSAFMKNNNAAMSLLSISVAPKLMLFQTYPSEIPVVQGDIKVRASVTGASIRMAEDILPVMPEAVDLEIISYSTVFIPSNIESIDTKEAESYYLTSKIGTSSLAISEDVKSEAAALEAKIVESGTVESQTVKIKIVESGIVQSGTIGTENVESEANKTKTAEAETIQSAKDGVLYSISTMASTPYKQVDFFKKIELADGQKKVLAVNLSLQPVDELLNSIKDLYPFLIGMALLLALFMALAYTQTVSKPIVAITVAANKMAAMELDTKLPVARADELGVLSGSLNTLSSNLKQAMEGLVIANKQLRNDYEGAVRQEKARKEFVANVSHEIKTPLGVIRSFSEALRDGVKEEKKDYYMEVILDEIGKSERLIKEMLEVSRLDAGAVVYKKKETDLNAIVKKAVGNFSKALEGRNLSVRVEEGLGRVLADEEKIGRVIANYLDNAVKYSDPGTVIYIRSELPSGLNALSGVKNSQWQDKKAGRIRLRVENICEPLPDEILERVWDRFYKGDASRNREKAGTGLGLAIVRSIMEGHGDGCGVENMENGVSFYIDLSVHNMAAADGGHGLS